MLPTRFPKPKYPSQDVPEEFEPVTSPVEPDEGPVPSFIPDDPEHEYDESTQTVAELPDPRMVQAKRDIEAGLVDTDMRATPGHNAKLRERMVPGPGGKPPPSGG